jgi:hypothetical protein
MNARSKCWLALVLGAFTSAACARHVVVEPDEVDAMNSRDWSVAWHGQTARAHQPAQPAPAPRTAQPTPSSSTSNTSTELGGMAPGKPALP